MTVVVVMKLIGKILSVLVGVGIYGMMWAMCIDEINDKKKRDKNFAGAWIMFNAFAVLLFFIWSWR